MTPPTQTTWLIQVNATLELATSLNTQEHHVLKIVSAYLALPNITSALVIKDLRLTASEVVPSPNLQSKGEKQHGTSTPTLSPL